MEKNTPTPMMEQYFRIKALHPDALLFFRLGDFYEMFYEDAQTGSRVLEIALTSRQNVPMCGVPFHAVNSYLAKLLRQGFKVAICEQVEDPKAAKGVVRREVVKVLTPGTAVEVDPERSKEAVFVAALHSRAGRLGPGPGRPGGRARYGSWRAAPPTSSRPWTSFSRPRPARSSCRRARKRRPWSSWRGAPSGASSAARSRPGPSIWRMPATP